MFLDRLLAKTTRLDDGCWYCSAGGENSIYGTIWYQGANISNHVASWLAHNGPIPTGKLVLHTCDYKRCVNPTHLFIGTNQDNSNDMIIKERQWKPKGELNSCALLTEEKVREIKYHLEHSGCTQQVIADYFGISQVTVSQINTGKRWAHVQ